MKRALLLAALALAGCPKSSPDHPPGNTGGRDFDERQACTVDTDCVPVEVECCDHCNGGTVVGVHRDHADEVRTAYQSPGRCTDIACTEMACIEPPTGICRQSICGVELGTREDVVPLPPL
jgi:hypothetical protein